MRHLLGTLVAGAVLCGACCQAGPAAATSFGREGSAAGEFEVPVGVAVLAGAGTAYIVDRSNQRVDRFTEAGAFLSAWGWGVADGHTLAAQECTASCFAGIPGEAGGQLGYPEGVAIDNDLLSSSFGDVYVVDARNHRVEKFSTEGAFLLAFGRNVRVGGGDVCDAAEACQAGEAGGESGELETLAGAIAVRSNGSVVVGDVNRLEIFSEAGTLQSEIGLSGAGIVRSVASDASGDIYVTAEGFQGVHKFDKAGAEVGVPRDAEGVPGVLAVGPSEQLYVADSAGGVHHLLEYDAAGAELANFDAGPEANPVSGLAVNGHGGIYVVEPTQVRVVSPPPEGPLVIEGTAAASAVAPTSAVLAGSFNPESRAGLKWYFEYGATAGYGATTAKEGATGEAFADEEVEAKVSGLKAATLYHFRLVVEGSKGEKRYSADVTFVTEPAVAVLRAYAEELTATSARIVAVLKTMGLATTYSFQYGLTTAYENSASIPEGEVDASPEQGSVEVLLQQLTPGTRYHFRIVASNAFGETIGADESFVTQGGVLHGLLDGRGLEMVSPSDKHGAALEGIANEGGLIQAAADGSALTYFSYSPIESGVEGNRSLADSQILGTRSANGWLSKDISVRHEQITGLEAGAYSEYQQFSSDLASAFVMPEGATSLTSDPQQERTPYRREANGEFVPLASGGDVKAGVKFGGRETLPDFFVGGVSFVSATEDGQFATLVSTQALTEELSDPEELQNVYEWHDGTLRLASVMPSGKAASEEHLGAEVGKLDRLVRGAISEDGSRVVFTTNVGEEHIYLRDMTLGETIQVDAAQPGSPQPKQPYTDFQAMSSDGKRVFFLSTDRLTRDSTARPNQPELYMCEVTTAGGHLGCDLEDLSVGGGEGEAGDVLGAVMGLGREGGYVYFVANGRLGGSTVRGDCEHFAPANPDTSCGVYVRDVAAKSTALVATVSGADQNDWTAGPGEDLGGMTSRVSENGRYLVFMSQRSLTGSDNRDAKTGAEDEEAYVYDQVRGSLTCVSCSAGGETPTGVFDAGTDPGLLVDRVRLWVGATLAGSIPGWTKVDTAHALYASRVVSNSGRVLFNSPVPLVPQDTNGKEDVYEYEPDDIGNCTRSGGCVGLISSGESEEESAFLDASAEGDDVFFITAAQLSPADKDQALDIYDAHVCSLAAPCAAAAPIGEVGCATAAGCRAPSVVGSPQESLASEAASGEGNAMAGPATHVVLSRAQKLARALKACGKLHKGKRRTLCLRRAHKLYGARTQASRRGRSG